LYVITCVPDDWAGWVADVVGLAGALALAGDDDPAAGLAGLDEQPTRPTAMAATATAASWLLFTERSEGRADDSYMPHIPVFTDIGMCSLRS
jgi:hypothetical protein